MRTLVLDQSYQPVNAVSWQRAMSYLARGKADVLKEYAVEVHATALMPAVVRLHTGVHRGKQKVKFSRQNVMARDRGRCQYCGDKLSAADLTYDHVIPRAQGGKTTWENIVMACIPCNRAKANRTPQQAEMRLLRQPERPTWVPRYNARLQSKDVPEEWREYWTVELEP